VEFPERNIKMAAANEVIYFSRSCE